MKLLLTGFDPFGGEAVNPSWEAVKEVSLPGDVELMKLQVPVVFGEAARTVLEAVRKHRPDAVVCVGQAGGRDKITPERVAVNVMDARICDNAGKQPVDCPVVSDGPAAYFSTLPIKKMAAAMEEVKALSTMMAATICELNRVINSSQKNSKVVLPAAKSRKQMRSMGRGRACPTRANPDSMKTAAT